LEVADCEKKPINAQNNINGIDGDPHKTGGGRAVHTLAIPAVTAIQEAYVRKVIDAVNDLGNVLYEIGNEHYGDSVEWQVYIINLIHAYEAQKPKQHPVGMTGGGPADALENDALFKGPADGVRYARYAQAGRVHSHLRSRRSARGFL